MLKGLRVRLVLLVLLAVCPVAALVVVSAAEQGRDGAERTKDDVLRLAEIAAAHEARLIVDVRQLLTVLSAVPELRGPNASRYLADLLRRNPAYVNLGVVGLDGRLLASAVEIPGDVNLRDRAYVARALETNDFAVGDYQIGRVTGQPSLNFGLPMRKADGALEGVVYAALGMGWTTELLGPRSLPDGATLLVVDRKGLVLARFPDEQGWTGRTLPDAPLIRAMLAERRGTTAVRGLDGVERLYAFTSLGDPRNPSAYLSIGFPAEAVYAPARDFLRRSLLWLGLATAAGLAAAWILGDLTLLRRLRGLAASADRLSAGRLDERAEPGGPSEIAALGEAFNRMAGRLQEQIQERERAKKGLEERVASLVSQRTRELTMLNELGDLLQACQSLDEAYAMIGRAGRAIFDTECGAVYLTNSSRNLVDAVARWGEDGAAPPAFDPDACWGLRRGQPHVVETAEDPALCRHVSAAPRVPSLCRPLSAHGETIGLLWVAAGREGLPPERRRLASAVAESVALALANLKLRESLRRQSVRDPLTDLFNRRHLEETLERELKRAARNKGPLSLLMMDVDHFKRFNDGFGHAAGDQVLRAIGQLLRQKCRGGDLPCRYGGEELTLVLPDTDLEGALAKAEQVRRDVAELRLEREGQPLGALTISIGVAAFPDHGATGEELFAAADAALYKAKKDGRNRVVAAE